MITAAELERETVQKVKVGEYLTIVERATPAIHGDMWELVTITDLRILQKKTDLFIPDHPGLGVPGDQLFVFKALRPGTVTVVLEHIRPELTKKIHVKVMGEDE